VTYICDLLFAFCVFLSKKIDLFNKIMICRYFGATYDCWTTLNVTKGQNKNRIHELKRWLILVYDYYDSKESVLQSRLLLTITKIKTCKITVVVFFCMTVKPGLSHDGIEIDQEGVRERGAKDGSWI
jgi:hypothetical protein